MLWCSLTQINACSEPIFRPPPPLPPSHPWQVSFDPMSHVTHPEDHIALSWRTPSGGSRHRRISPCSPTTSNVISNLKPSASDGGGSQVWPGVGAEPPLIITTDELTVRFVSAAGAAAAGGVEAASGGEEQDKRLAREATTASPAWGFRLTARGQEVGVDRRNE